MIIRAFEERDWGEVWPIVREVVRAAETYTYDPAMTEDVAYAVWIEPADDSGLTVVTVEDGRIVYETLGFSVVGTVPGAFEHPTLGRVGLHVIYRDVATV